MAFYFNILFLQRWPTMANDFVAVNSAEHITTTSSLRWLPQLQFPSIWMLIGRDADTYCYLKYHFSVQQEMKHCLLMIYYYWYNLLDRFTIRQGALSVIGWHRRRSSLQPHVELDTETIDEARLEKRPFEEWQESCGVINRLFPSGHLMFSCILFV